MKDEFVASLVLAFILTMFLSGCGNNVNTQSEKQIQKPQRIVSLNLATDEIIIGLVPIERIAALTYLSDDGRLSNITEQAKQVPNKIRANAETIIGLKPDLVIVADWQPAELVQILRDQGIVVYVYKTPNTIAAVQQSIAEIAHIVGEEQAGQKMINDMDQQLASITGKIKEIPADKRQNVVRLTVAGDGDGNGSMFDDICHYAGVTNGAAVIGLGRNDSLTKEQIVQINPDILLIPTWDYTGKADAFKTDVQSDPALQTVKAVREQKIIAVQERFLSCSSQYVVYGVRNIAKAAYPIYMGQ